MISAFPKVFAIGTDYIKDIFNGEVEVSEKIDGSQIAWGKVKGELHIRSKGAALYKDYPEKMFAEGISYIKQIEDLLPEGLIFYAEYLKTPKHNTLKYNRIPQNHLMLFAVMHANQKFDESHFWAEKLGIEHVPILKIGNIGGAPELIEFLNYESILGGARIEGIVVKNYQIQFLLGGHPIPLMA